MKPLSESRLFAWLCIILLAGILAGISTAAWAGGDEIKQVTNVENDISNTLIGGDNVAQGGSVSGSRSYGVGMGSIDVDIAQCMASESTGVLVVQWQRLKDNPWCMAETLDAKGLHEAAAKVRCSIDSYREIFTDNQECMALSTAKTEVLHVEQPAAVEEDEHEEEIDTLYALVSAAQEEAAQAKAEARKAQRAAQSAPDIAIQRQMDEDARRRANARAVLEGKQ